MVRPSRPRSAAFAADDRPKGARSGASSLPWRAVRAGLASTLALAACGGDDRGVVFDGSEGSLGGGQASASGGKTTTGPGASGTTGGSSAGAASATATSGPGADSASEGAGVMYDVGAPSGTDDVPPASGEGCTAVDILFVIDNSLSMLNYQNALRNAFPRFAGAMAEALPPGTDLHVAVTTSSFCRLEANPGHSENNCIPAEPLATMRNSFITPDQATVAHEGFQGRLRPWQGKTYFAANTADPTSITALSEWFSGAAAVGNAGCSLEFNAAAAAYAFHPANAQANAGFLRDAGAVLLIFVLSDEADQSFDVADRAALRDLILAKKAACGGDKCIIGAGLFSQFCTPAHNASYTFLQSFGEDPVWGPIGTPVPIPMMPQPDYEKTVRDAMVPIVAETCRTLTPPR